MITAEDRKRIFYDAQLKKMLAYIGSALASFVAQFAVLTFVQRASDILLKTGILTLSMLLWLSQFFLIFAIASKFEELVNLEMDLELSPFFSKLHASHSAKFWDKLSKRLVFGKTSGEPKRVGWFLDVMVAFAILTSILPLSLVIAKLLGLY